ncbi:MAG TPA: cupin domain-containing protein [Thermoleophilaceae bacterium]|nr:cupin domain-containing protein [Thermoleophilaceae bacterium]
MPTVVPLDELRKSPTACLFEGGDEFPASMFVTEHPRGKGAALHFHPYPEAFVVLAGEAVFTVGDERVTVAGGNVVVVPADTPHGFESAADDPLRIVSVHPSPRVQQTWL